MFALFTDFGWQGPYVGQMKAALVAGAPAVPIVDLMHDLPAWQPRLSAYLLAAYSEQLPKGTISVCVVDPGVGSGRAALAMEVGGNWFVGPDNGLLALVARRAPATVWRLPVPSEAAPTFHGRDLFAPAAADIARGGSTEGERVAVDSIVGANWPADLAKVVYVDAYGNAVTGLRGAGLAETAVLCVGGRTIRRARTFADVPAGEVFCYVNSSGLLELAANQARADKLLGLEPGGPIEVCEP